MKKFIINGQVMINATLFREKNLNYFFLNIDEKLFEDDLDDEFYSEDKSSGNGGVITKQKASYPPEELLLYNETVYGFYFIIKL